MLLDRIKNTPPDTIAAIDSIGTQITYGELVGLSQTLAQKMGIEPKLILLEASSTVEWLVAYVACLSAKQPMVIAPANNDTVSNLAATFDIDLTLLRANNYQPLIRQSSSRKSLHPDLALMLSTSGSTGSPKCVKLSLANISANAASIGEYLNISSDERGVVNLPTHYSYGLSVVNSHLYAGATLLLTDHSVIDDQFWAFLRENEATSFQGVPHVYDLLQKVDFENLAPKSLRYFTQAGGRLDAQKVQHFHALAQAHDWRFYVMYGQTEATARMAYMPPESLAAYPSSIGVPIPRGKFSIQGDDGSPVGIDQEGELVYEGPNVMMGYATNANELANEPMKAKLVTGDLARVDSDGFYYITGRLSRFIKIFGNRIGLDDVERKLSSQHIEAKVTGIDDHLIVAALTDADEQKLCRILEEDLKLPKAYYSIHMLDEYPLLSSGKVDYKTIKTLGESASFQEKPGFISRFFGKQSSSGDQQNVADVFESVFGKTALEDGVSFRSLGGDSLTYVKVASVLEARIANLPNDWADLPIKQLILMEEKSDENHSGVRLNQRNFDTLRAMACLLVVIFHVVGEPDKGLEQTEGFLRWAVDSLEYIRMPLFITMAGFFYAAMPVSGEGLGGFLSKRFQMLMIPALTVSLIYWGTRQIGYGEYEPLLPQLLSGYLHLWFLYALMIIMTFAALLDCFIKNNTWLWAALIIVAPLIALNSPHIGYLSVDQAIRYLCFFAIGVLVFRHRYLLTHRGILGVCSVAAIFSITLQQLEMSGMSLAFFAAKYMWFVGGISCVVVLMFVMPRIPFIEAISVFSYVIYLWHSFANAVAREFLQFLNVNNLWVLVVVGIIAGVVGPIILHKIVSKFPRFMGVCLLGQAPQKK